MQTFMPLPDFEQTARALDYRRLGKQRVEAEQILRALLKLSGGWAHHPAVLMWRGHEGALADYRDVCICEWIRRGYKHTFSPIVVHSNHELPPWLGDAAFHRSHQSNLIRKLPSWYGPQFQGVPADLPYIWPVSKNVLS